MTQTTATSETLRVGIVSVSDRASKGVYEDQGIPALQAWLERAVSTPVQTVSRLIQDEAKEISAALIELVDVERCHLVLTTGGTGPARRDVTPEATQAVATREMPGFGEQMRQISLRFVPTAILSRQTAVLREIEGHAALVINLPGQPKAIAETLEGLKDENGKSIVPVSLLQCLTASTLLAGLISKPMKQSLRPSGPRVPSRNRVD